MNLECHIDTFKEFLFSEKNLSQNSINNYLVDLNQFLIPTTFIQTILYIY